MKRSALIAFAVLLSLPPLVLHARTTTTFGQNAVGAVCNNVEKGVDFDAIAQCNAGTGAGTMQTAPIVLGTITSPPYANTTCDASKAGMLQWTGTSFQACGGTSWGNFAAGGALDDLTDAKTNYSSPYYNVFVGSGAGDAITGGGYNTALGYSALASNTSGSANTALGASALQANTTGSWNTAVGWEALSSNSTGASNTALGMRALRTNSTGHSNTAVGRDALYSNTSGHANTSLGYYALTSTTTGFGNTAIGYNALYSNTSGVQNVALGAGAQYANSTGNYNTALGVGAMQAKTTGSNNTALGYGVGQTTLTTGSNNILIGTSSAVTTPASDTSNFLNIGNTIYGNLATGYVGIGTTTPYNRLDVSSGGINAGGSINYHTDNRLALGIIDAIPSNDNGSYVGWLNSTAGYTAGSLALISRSSVATPIIFFTGTGTSTEKMRIGSNGYVGIGTTTPSSNLEVLNTLTATGHRPIALNANLGTIKIKANAGGWANYLGFIGSSGTEHGGFGAYGTLDSLGYYYIGAAFDSPSIYIYPNGDVSIPTVGSALSFGANTRQMLNLYNTSYGLGVQNNTLYFRTGNHFSWFRGGTHSTTENDPGSGGVALMRLSSEADLDIGYQNAYGTNVTIGSNSPSASAHTLAIGDRSAAGGNLGVGGYSTGGSSVLTVGYEGAGPASAYIGYSAGGASTLHVGHSTGANNAVVYIGNAASTGSTVLEVGSNSTNTHSSYIDITGDATYPDYGLRIARGSGPNGGAYIVSRGTGALFFQTNEAGEIGFNTAGARRLTISASGNVTTTENLVVNGSTIVEALTVTGGTASTGYRTRNGVSGAYQATKFNISWENSVPRLYINDSNLGVFTLQSDYRLKKDVKTVESGLDRVMKLRPVSFRWKDIDVFKDDGKRHESFIAHELQEIIPSGVDGEKDAVDEKGKPQFQSLNMAGIVSVLTKGVQELADKVKAIEDKISSLLSFESRIAKLEAENKELKARLKATIAEQAVKIEKLEKLNGELKKENQGFSERLKAIEDRLSKKP